MKSRILILLVIFSLFTFPMLRGVFADTTAPTISNVDYSPRIPTAEDQVTVTASVVDTESGVSFVALFYSANAGAWHIVSMSNTSGSTYSAVIPKLSSGTVVQFKVLSQDNAGNAAWSSVVSYTVTAYVSSMGVLFFILVLVIIVVSGAVSTLLVLTVKPRPKPKVIGSCPTCGHDITSEAAFCPNCGKKIE